MGKKKEKTFDEIIEEQNKQAIDERLKAHLQNVSEQFNFDDLEDGDVLESGAAFFNFEKDGPELIGVFQSKLIAKDDGPIRDGKPQWSKGETIGFNMLAKDHGYVICPNNYLIAEHLENAKPGQIFKITFQGKVKSKSGYFSRFLIREMHQKGKK